MINLRILIDVDDVLEDLSTQWVQWLDEKYGLSVKPEDIVSWDMHEFFPTLTDSELYSPLHSKRFWNEMTPKDGAVEYVKRLKDDGHDVVIVTASHPDTVPKKMGKFLFKYFPYISFKDVIITSRKQMISGDVLIDDAPHNLVGGCYMKILMTANHNRSYDAESNMMIRVNDWKEAYDAINRLDVIYNSIKKRGCKNGSTIFNRLSSVLRPKRKA